MAGATKDTPSHGDLRGQGSLTLGVDAVSEVKFCKKCERNLPKSDFYKHHETRDGLRGLCKTCFKAQCKSNPNRLKSAKARYYKNVEASRAKVKLRSEIYRERHKDRLAVERRAKYREDPTVILSAAARWRKNHPDRARQSSLNWHAKNPDRAAHYEANRRALKRGGGQTKISPQEWILKQQEYDFRCAYCFALTKLTRDHVVPLAKGGKHTIGNIVPACITCNSSKSKTELLEWLWKPTRK